MRAHHKELMMMKVTIGLVTVLAASFAGVSEGHQLHDLTGDWQMYTTPSCQAPTRQSRPYLSDIEMDVREGLGKLSISQKGNLWKFVFREMGQGFRGSQTTHMHRFPSNPMSFKTSDQQALIKILDGHIVSLLDEMLWVGLTLNAEEYESGMSLASNIFCSFVYRQVK